MIREANIGIIFASARIRYSCYFEEDTIQRIVVSLVADTEEDVMYESKQR